MRPAAGSLPLLLLFILVTACATPLSTEQSSARHVILISIDTLRADALADLAFAPTRRVLQTVEERCRLPAPRDGPAKARHRARAHLENRHGGYSNRPPRLVILRSRGEGMSQPIRVAIVTVSDGVASGARQDRGGPACEEALADLVPEQPFKLTVRRRGQLVALDVPAADRASP